MLNLLSRQNFITAHSNLNITPCDVKYKAFKFVKPRAGFYLSSDSLWAVLAMFGKDFIVLGRTLLFWKGLYYSQTLKLFLEQLELDGQILLRVLSEVVD